MGKDGFVKEFVDDVWKPLMKEIIAKNIRIVTNAGGMNPVECKNAIENAAREAGIDIPIVAAVEGDNITEDVLKWIQDGKIQSFKIEGEEDDLSFIGKKKLLSANAYLGAFPIARALEYGAQIVVTGRCVDSALALGPLIYEFGWKEHEYDKLASGSVAGHLIECGSQSCGGNFTDWELSLSGGWINVGFPIIECKSDGSFILSKPQNTGGIVTKATVAEQLVYEILNPSEYILPDVIVDFTNIKLEELEKDRTSGRVKISNCRGYPSTNTYKASLTFLDGWKCEAFILIGGFDAVKKAKAVGEAIIGNTNRILSLNGMNKINEYNIDIIGSEVIYGNSSKALDNKEVNLKISVKHKDRNALITFTKEVAPSATSMAPGIFGDGRGRPQVVPHLNYRSCLISKDLITCSIYIGNRDPILFKDKVLNAKDQTKIMKVTSKTKDDLYTIPSRYIEVPLIKIAHGRSGDKGDTCNIGIICRNSIYYNIIKSQLTEDAVSEYLKHLVKGKVVRYEIPGINAFNFVCTKALGGGGLSSLTLDKQGKSFAQVLLSFPIKLDLNAKAML